MSKNRPDPATLPYRPCVGMVVFNRTGLVWAGRRIAEPASEMDGAAQLWQLPQGGIDRGEDPYAAALRELYEETGMRSVSLLAEAPDWFRYDLPAHLVGVALKGRFRGQEQKWFAFRFEGEDTEIAIDPPPGGNHAEFDRWDWLPLSTLPGLIVPFKRPVYDRVVDTFAGIAG